MAGIELGRQRKGRSIGADVADSDQAGPGGEVALDLLRETLA
jgi:hypothetical protein